MHAFLPSPHCSKGDGSLNVVSYEKRIQEERKRKRKRRRRKRRGLINLENDNPTPDCHNGVLFSSQGVDTGKSKGMRVMRTICEILVFRLSLKR